MASQLQILAGTMADDATVGTVAWSNPDNAKVSDNVYAVFNQTGTVTTHSHYLKATSFGFSIPTGATINGILVEIERKSTGVGSGYDDKVQIVKADGTIGTTNKAIIPVSPNFVGIYPSSDTYCSYGSSSDLWGETWDSTKINDVDFGVVLSALVSNLDGGQSVSVD